MKLDVRIDPARGDLAPAMQRVGSAFRDAADAVAVRSTAETVDRLRQQIGAQLSARAAGTITSRQYVSKRDGSVRGLIFSRWWRRAADGVGAKFGRNDMLWAFERGVTITPKRGRALVMPLPAAYNAVGQGARGSRAGRRGAKAPTTVDVEAALNQDLFEIRRPGRPTLLCAKDVFISAGRRGTIRAARFRNRRGTISKRRTTAAVVPMFVLLKNVTLPRRLGFDPVVAAAEARMGELLVIELARKGVIG